MVEGARLEIVWAAMSRRFESSRFRQEVKYLYFCIDILLFGEKLGFEPRFVIERSEIDFSLASSFGFYYVEEG